MTLLQLGRYGDILNVLPILWDEYQKTQEKQKLVVSRDYADVLEGCSYVEPIIFNGPFSDIKGAMEFCREALPTQVVGPSNVVISQVYGAHHDITQNTESFQKEAYRLAGRLNLWSSQPPLVFDQRDPKREQELVDRWIKPTRPVIIVSDNGFSSPFQYRDLLRELLERRFERHQILYLDVVKAHRIYDLLGLMDHPNVKCIVATDSAPLHLTHACSKPVCALVTDTPTLWHGSAYRPQHLQYIRYKNFPRDAVRMLETIETL